jgi:hypothetical protein
MPLQGSFTGRPPELGAQDLTDLRGRAVWVLPLEAHRQLNDLGRQPRCALARAGHQRVEPTTAPRPDPPVQGVPGDPQAPAERIGVLRGALLRRWVVGSGQAELMRRRPARVPTPRSGFAGFRFPPEVILVAVRWYLRYGLSYRDVEELLAERGIEVDHVSVYRWVQRFTPLLIDAARPCRHSCGDRWFVDETYVKVSGRWTGGVALAECWQAQLWRCCV